jgi:hypothetical protein
VLVDFKCHLDCSKDSLTRGNILNFLGDCSLFPTTMIMLKLLQLLKFKLLQILKWIGLFFLLALSAQIDKFDLDSCAVISVAVWI